MPKNYWKQVIISWIKLFCVPHCYDWALMHQSLISVALKILKKVIKSNTYFSRQEQPSPFKQIFLHWSYITYYFYCPAFNKTLWLEYLVEINKKHYRK